MERISKIFLLLLLCTAFISNISCSKKSYTPSQALEIIDGKLKKTIEKDSGLKHGILHIYSKPLGIDHGTAVGTSFGKAVKPSTRFHGTSVGKTHMVAAAMRLHEKGRLNIEDNIADYLPEALLDGLFLVAGKDYSAEVKIKHLMNHTSGAADYYENTAKGVMNIKQDMLSNHDKLWTAQELIRFAAENLEPAGKPGEKFLYSDTGYDLLGLVMEKATGKPLDRIIYDEVIRPLRLRESQWIFYNNIDKKPLYPETYVDGVEVSKFKSVSLSRGGGNILASAKDFILFNKALVEGKLLSKKSLKLMLEDDRKFGHGMRYSYGLFHIDIDKMTFGLMPKELNMWGNMGSTATFMFYNPELEVYVAGAFNNSDFVSGQVQFLIEIMDVLSKVSLDAEVSAQ